MMRGRGSSETDIQREIDRIAYFATDLEDWEHGDAYDAQFSYQLGQEIMRLLRLEYGSRGVFSLSEKWDEPLLWSHYAAQHQGICIEYDTTDCNTTILNRVDYTAPRAILAQDLCAWKCDGDVEAEQRVFDTYFLAKAPQWSYEAEWRDIADKSGSNPCGFDVTAVHFGMRVEFVWQWLFVKALNQDPQVTLYDVFANEMTFDLERRELDRSELESRSIDQPLFRIFSGFSEADLENMSVGEKAINAPQFRGRT